MLLLTSISDLVKCVTDASGDIEVHASYVDNASGVITPGRTNTASIVTNTTTTIVGSPGASTQRNVKELSLRNNHGSQAVACTISHTDGSNDNTIIKCTLLAGESLIMDGNGVWTHYDVNGGVYLTPGPVASQAEMEAGSSTSVFVTPGRQHYHPGSAKFWVVFTGNSTTILASYNMTSISDGSTEATVTIATDFSSANWCNVATAEGAATSAAGARLASCRAIAAGTIIVFCMDAQATPALADPTRWHVCGFGDQ